MTPSNNELSSRELEILRMVATGASNKEIASRLFISANTVKVHLRNIFTKVGVSSRTEAAMYAVNAGIISAVDQDRSIQYAQPYNEQYGQLNSNVIPFPSSQRRSRLAVIGGVVGLLIIIIVVAYFYAFRQLRDQETTLSLPADQAQRWQTLAVMPTARYGLAVAVAGSNIYAIAGMTSEGITNAVERYDPASNTWTVVTGKPTAVYEVNAVSIGGRLYVPGGKLASGKTTGILEVYDPDLDRWTKGATMPVALSSYTLVSLEGQMYLFGGWDGQDYVDKVYEYDPQIDIWQEKTPLPSPRGYSSAAVAEGKIFVVGGYDGSKALRTNDIYQPTLDHDGSDPWSSASPMPTGRKAMGVASIADILVVIGGTEDRNQTPPSLMYFTVNDEWQVFGRLISQPWSNLGVIPLGTYVFILGGEIDGKPSNLAFSYLAIYTLSIPIVK
jgi:DNA-binding CsgD family transcriptional regulator/N-acetylneuraminic acid mutarotase